MEIPNKVYLEVLSDSEPKKVCKSVIKFKRTLEDDIEYIRTDSFIEKACEWLKNNASNYASVDTDRIGNVADIDFSIIQDFKNYMKKE